MAALFGPSTQEVTCFDMCFSFECLVGSHVQWAASIKSTSVFCYHTKGPQVWVGQHPPKKANEIEVSYRHLIF